MERITQMELKDIIDRHKKWLNGKEGGEKADLSYVDLSGLKLRGTDLKSVNLNCANLSNAKLNNADLTNVKLINANFNNADLTNADLTNVNLTNANFNNANLTNADLTNANLTNAYLRFANLINANLSNANLSNANLENANLENANLTNVNLIYANLSNTNLTNAKGLISTKDYMNKYFEFDKKNNSYIAYKVFGLYKTPPTYWNIEENSIIEENCNMDRKENCSFGINCANLDWIKKRNHKDLPVWKVLVKIEDICIPFATDGKSRCKKALLLNIID